MVWIATTPLPLKMWRNHRHSTLSDTSTHPQVAGIYIKIVFFTDFKILCSQKDPALAGSPAQTQQAGIRESLVSAAATPSPAAQPPPATPLVVASLVSIKPRPHTRKYVVVNDTF